ncbi:MAG TPA: DUF1801 domain-containing protein [Candidatus Limnocylindria bacterium]|nr:DUF1801 domain-containing protein [Candidatus Limnocylindria bacterium]
MSYQADPRVDAYIDALPAWQQEICRLVREVVHEADPEVVETIKRRVQPYFVLDGNIAALLAAKDHVNVFIYDPLVSDPDGIITHGHGNATGRQIWINEGDPINVAALKRMFEEIIARNRAGGWRRVVSA